MSVIDYLVFFAIFMLVVTMILMFIAKKRMDRNEPVFGWKRKQYLNEINGDNESASASTKSVDKKTITKRKDEESILELMELKEIERGVVTRERNEYLAILYTDFVNFHLLKPSERVSILEGYSRLFSAINFPIQI